MSGHVINRAEQPLPRTHYGALIVGGGLLGLAVARYLAELAPGLATGVLEQDGVPSEMGETWAAPGLITASDPRAAWMLAEYRALDGMRLDLTGLLRADPAGVPLADLPLENEQCAAVRALLGEGHAHFLWEPNGGYGSAEAAALALGRRAVALGADLYLNARVVPQGRGLRLERLAFDRHMTRVVAGVAHLTADTLILAAGASTPALAEALAGVVTPYRLAYRQYPRLGPDARLPLREGRAALPVVQAAGFTLRPQGDGLLVVPPALGPDPAGYRPQGGEMMGVRVGVRRELLELFLQHLDDLPFLSWESLNLGKTPSGVRGAWQIVTPDGQPDARELAPGVWALVGGDAGFSLGLAAAYDVAARVAGREGRPWAE